MCLCSTWVLNNVSTNDRLWFCERRACLIGWPCAMTIMSAAIAIKTKTLRIRCTAYAKRENTVSAWCKQIHRLIAARRKAQVIMFNKKNKQGLTNCVWVSASSVVATTCCCCRSKPRRQQEHSMSGTFTIIIITLILLLVDYYYYYCGQHDCDDIARSAGAVDRWQVDGVYIYLYFFLLKLWLYYDLYCVGHCHWLDNGHVRLRVHRLRPTHSVFWHA